jgi:hypothetical protein
VPVLFARALSSALQAASFRGRFILGEMIIPSYRAQVNSRHWLEILSLLVFAVFAASAQEVKHRPAAVRPATDPSAEKPANDPTDVISSQRLNPPLRADSRLRFSRDGSHLLIQDQAGIFVLTHKPLRILFTRTSAKLIPPRSPPIHNRFQSSTEILS